MKGYSVTDIFTEAELDVHRTATLLVGNLPDIPELRCHELARAVAEFLTTRYVHIGFHIVDGKFGTVDHSWLVFRNPRKDVCYRHTILDVYSVGSVPVVQLHCADALGLRNARRFIEGQPRDDIDTAMIEHVLKHLR